MKIERLGVSDEGRTIVKVTDDNSNVRVFSGLELEREAPPPRSTFINPEIEPSYSSQPIPTDIQTPGDISKDSNTHTNNRLRVPRIVTGPVKFVAGVAILCSFSAAAGQFAGHSFKDGAPDNVVEAGKYFVPDDGFGFLLPNNQEVN